MQKSFSWSQCTVRSPTLPHLLGSLSTPVPLRRQSAFNTFNQPTNQPVSPLQIGLGIHCVRISPSVDSETVGSYPPSGLANRLGCFLHISCSKSTHEPLLTTHRLKLSLNYVLKLKSLLENPAYSCVFEPENTKLFEESEPKVPPLGIRILPHLEKSKLNLNLVDDAPSLDMVPWKLSVPAVQFDLASLKKDTTNPEIYKQLYLQLITEYPLSEKERKKLIHRRF